MNQQSLVNHLETDLKAEVVSQSKLLNLLEMQASSLSQRTSEALEKVTEELSSTMAKANARQGRREEWLHQLAACLGAPAQAATLGSLTERLGSDGAVLSQLRLDLRQVSAKVLRTGRRNARLIAAHAEVVSEALATLFDSPSGNDHNEGGALLDARV